MWFPFLHRKQNKQNFISSLESWRRFEKQQNVKSFRFLHVVSHHWHRRSFCGHSFPCLTAIEEWTCTQTLTHRHSRIKSHFQTFCVGEKAKWSETQWKRRKIFIINESVEIIELRAGRTGGLNERVVKLFNSLHGLKDNKDKSFVVICVEIQRHNQTATSTYVFISIFIFLLLTLLLWGCGTTSWLLIGIFNYFFDHFQRHKLVRFFINYFHWRIHLISFKYDEANQRILDRRTTERASSTSKTIYC